MRSNRFLDYLHEHEAIVWFLSEEINDWRHPLGRVLWCVMKTRLVVILVLSWSICGFAAPHIAFRDLPEAILGGDVGGASLACELSLQGWRGSITRNLSPRIDVSASMSAQNMFDLDVRVLVVKNLLPLNVVVALSSQRLSLISTLFLGPVHVNYGRTWGEEGVRWGYLQHAFHQTMSILIGLEQRNDAIGAILGLRIHPGRTRLWGASLLVTSRGARLTVGGPL